jgi:hypothetical protein
MEKQKTKIISEIDTGENVLTVKKPFKLYTDRQRRYIRLEISEPVGINILRDRTDGFWPQGDGPQYDGSILNISAGGVLMLSSSALEEGSLILLNFTLQELETVDQVVGIVKRAEMDEHEWLIGVEFISREYLVDFLSSAELDLLTDGLDSFDERLKKTLNKYVQYKKADHAEK